jgi:hypothetical protein
LATRLLLLASFCFLSWVVWGHASDTGSVIGRFTDHLHHAQLAWTSMHVGVWRTYREPFGTLVTAAAPYRLSLPTWEAVPNAYPPGALLLFLPPALVAQYSSLAMEAFGKLTIVYLLGFSHVALSAIVKVLRREPASGTFVAAVIWLFLARATMCGFYDGVWLACGAFCIAALGERKYTACLLWFAVASLLSYRAASLMPLAGVAAVRLLAPDRRSPRTWVVLAGTAAVGLLCLYTFSTFRHALAGASADTLAQAASPLLPLAFTGKVVILFGALLGIYLLVRGDWLAALTCCVATAITLVHAGHSWHGSVLIPTVLCTGIGGGPRVGSSRVVVTLWMLTLWQLVYAYPPLAFVGELATCVETLVK